MANPEHVEMLVNSTAEQWNAWRERVDVAPDLSGLDFVRAFRGNGVQVPKESLNLTGYNLSAANLTCADMSWTLVSRNDFEEADTSCAWLGSGAPRLITEGRGETICRGLCPVAFRPDPDWLKLLFAGREKWNAWRSENPQDIPELSGMQFADEFQNADFSPKGQAVDLSRFNFRNARLRGANLKNTNLDDADLSNADLRCSYFAATEARRTNFVSADLRRSEIFLSKFKEANVTVARSNLIKISHVDFRESKLSGLNFDKAQLIACDLTDAEIHNTSFDGTEMNMTIMVRTEFVESDVSHAHLFAFWRFDLRESFPVGATTNAESVQDLLDLLDSVGLDLELNGLKGLRSLYFRGLPDIRFALTSSAMRDTGYRDDEDLMMNELAVRRPTDINADGPFFERLVTARHYELPTRLLDITRDPLVALYYAVSGDHPEADGVVHLFVVPEDMIFPYDSDTVSVMSNFTRLEPDEKEFLLTRISFPEVQPRHQRTVLGLSDNRTRRTRTRLSHFIAQEKPYWVDRIDARDFFRVLVVEPRRTFDRLRAHKGAFMLSAFHERFERWEIDKVMEGAAPYGHLCIVIPADAKAGIVSQLNQLGVTEDGLKADLQSAAEAIARQHRSGIDPFAS